MKTFRKIIFWLHLIAGSAAGLVIFTMCVTGSLLAFEKQITRFSERNLRFVGSQSITGLSISELLKRVNGVVPDSISISSDSGASVIFTIGRESVLYVNPYTGKILGKGSDSVRKFFRTTTNIHLWLAAKDENRETARTITGICNAAFLLLAISGLFLWWPSKWNHQKLRAVTWFQSKLRARARDFNWHNTIGFWCAPILIVLTLTGLIMSFQWANNLLYTLTGSEKPPATNARGRSSAQNEIPSNIDPLVKKVEENFPGWKTITIRTPSKDSSAISFTVEANESINPFARSEIRLSAKTGEIIKRQSYSANNTGRKLRIWARGLHTGEALRIPGQVVAFIASTGGGFLVFTGLSLALRRFSNFSKRSLSHQRSTSKRLHESQRAVDL